MRATTLFLLVCGIALSACGSKAAATGATTPDDPAVAEPAPAADRDCEALLAHIEEVTVEAIDHDGMMEACQGEWDDARADCLAAATDDDGIAACW